MSDRTTQPRDLRRLIELPALVRRLYPRGGFEGLDAHTLQVLVAVACQEETTVGEIVDRLALGQGTVSTAASRLQEAALIQSKASKADGRRRLLTTTAKGRRLVARFERATQSV